MIKYAGTPFCSPAFVSVPSTAKPLSDFDLYIAVGEKQSDLLPIASCQKIPVTHPDSSGNKIATTRTRNILLVFIMSNRNVKIQGALTWWCRRRYGALTCSSNG